LEKELQNAKITNAGQAQELQHFEQLKEELAGKMEQIGILQTTNGTLEKELGQTQAKLETLEEIYEKLSAEYKILQERFEHLQEDNHKYQVNNARLLMKLEAENRHTSSKLEMMQEHRKELKSEFERLAKQIFEGNSEKFAEFSKQNIDSMIKPLQSQIEEFKKQVSETYNTESQDRERDTFPQGAQ